MTTLDAPVLQPGEGIGAIPGPRSIRRFTAAVARTKAGASLGSVLNDAYYAVIMMAIGMGVALGVAGQLRSSLPPQDAASLGEGISLPTVVAVCAVAVLGAVLSLAGRLGPVGAEGAEATWWLGLPVDRRGLLRPASLRIPVLAALIGGVLLALLDGGLLADHGIGHVLRLGALAALCCAAVVLLAGLAQTVQFPRRSVALIGDLVIALAPVLALVAALTGWRLSALPDLPEWALVLLALAVLALGWVQDRRLDRIRGRNLRESGSVASQAAGAVVSLDSRELGRALSDAAARQRRRRSRRLRAVRGPKSAIVVADLMVLVRSPRHLVQLVVSALVPVLVVITPRLAGALGVGLAVLVSGYVGMLATAEGARRAEMAPILDRLLPMSAQATRRTRLLVPALAMLLWSLVAFTAVGLWHGDPAGWIALGVASTPVWAGAALRGAFRPAPNWQGPLVSTPAGALPGGVLAVLARGPDVAVLGLIPVIISVALGRVLLPVLAVQLVFSLIAWTVGASTNTKPLMERMLDQQKALEAQR